MKKIIIWEALDIISGGQRVALNVLDALSSKYSCSFIVPSRGALSEEVEMKHIPLHFLSVGRYSDSKKSFFDVLKLVLYLPISLLKSVKLIKQNKIDLIYVNMARAFIWATLTGFLLSVPVVWHVHNCFNDKKTLFLLRFLGQFKCVKKIIFVSNTVQSQFPELGYKSEIIYNSIDESKFTFSFSGNNTLKKELAIPLDKKVISTIGLIIPEKGQDVFIRSIPSIIRSNKNIHFLIIGRPVDTDFQEMLKKLVIALKVEEYVTFTGHRTDINELYKVIDINTINSVVSFEACPLVILEGNAAGVPTVGSDIGGTVELIEDQHTGLLYTAKQTEELANAIISLLQNEKKLKEMTTNCINKSRKFTTNLFNDKIHETVDRVLKTTT